MKIEILGAGCAKCIKLYDNTMEALKQCVKEAEVVKVDDKKKIRQCGIMSTPAIVVDGNLKAFGRLLSAGEIKSML